MPENGKISIRQFTLLVMIITIGDSILVLPSITVFKAQQDAWISSFIGVAVGLFAVYIFSMVGKIYPHLTLVQSIQEILGKWIGTIISFSFLFYLFLSAASHLREIGDFITSEMMPATPISAILILFIAVVIMGGRLGLEVIGRTAELLFPVIILLFIILVIFLTPEAEIENLQPILENGIKPVLKGTISFIAFPFLELVVLLMIFPYVIKREQIKKGFLQGTLLGGVILIILIVISILVLGADETSRSLYPSYSLARRVSIDSFFERVEAMLALMWLLTIFIKITVYYLAFNIGLAQLLKLKDYRMLTLPTGFLLVVLSLIVSSNVTYFNNVIAEYWPFYDMTYGFLLPVILLGVYFIRKGFKSLIKTST
ncbi:GerAB/ArcD/ProY family transporter [Paenibacillus sp. FA6]|uniref:GerAB/ArcD/ProY family transporter n=1 Tax=Paenibacillus sp. FA6 TaxID=3413029 RepID=UPI003F655B06